MTFCALGENCSVFDRSEKLPGLSRNSNICEGCINRCRNDLNLLRYDYVDLSQLLIPAEARNDAANIFRPKPESSPPMNLQVFTLRSQIAEALTATEDATRRHLSERTRHQPTREGFAADAAVRYLAERIPAIVDVRNIGYGPPESPVAGTEMIVEFGTLHRRSRRAAGLLTPTVALPGACPSCQVPALRRHADDQEKVWCARCHQAMCRDDYHAALRMQVAPVTDAQPDRSP